MEVKQTWKRRIKGDRRSRCSSLSGCDWLESASPCHLQGEEEGARRRCKRGEERRRGEGKPLSSLSLSLISGSSGACFPRVPHFQISYLGPVLSIAVLYFYMSFACSSSNLAPSIFCSWEYAFTLLLGCSHVVRWPYSYLVRGTYSVNKILCLC